MPSPEEMLRNGDQSGLHLHELREDTPAYKALNAADLLTTKYRRRDIDDIFTGADLTANSTKQNDMMQRLKFGYYCCVGIPIYHMSHVEMFVPAGHVGLLMNEKNEYLFAQPGMHNIQSCFLRQERAPTPLRGHITHGNRTIVIIEQGFIGYAMDNGQPVLLPPGIHVWRSESLFFQRQIALNDHLIELGPYTLVTVDEGYAAVTQDNGKQRVLKGGHTHLLSHKNWKFEKFMTLKIQTDELERIEATSADNINMMVTSTVNWKILNVETAATMAAETMATSGKAGDVNADITKLRRDVLKQAIASLAAFIGSVNYSESFHMTAMNQQKTATSVVGVAVGTVSNEEGGGGGATHDKGFTDNPLYDTEKMSSAVSMANAVTRSYGVEIMSINIISALPNDQALTKSLASGAVASAEALQAETAARGQANALKIQAEADAEQQRINARAQADAELIRAKGLADAERVRAEGDKAGLQLRAEGEADGIRALAGAIRSEGGSDAMAQRIAEQYVTNLGSMARESNMIIVPDKPNDLAGVVTTALSLGSSITGAAGAAKKA